MCAFCILLPTTVGNFCRLLCTLVQLNTQRQHSSHLVHLCAHCKHLLISALYFFVSALILKLLLSYGIFSRRMLALDLISSAKDSISSLYNLFWWDGLLKIYIDTFFALHLFTTFPLEWSSIFYQKPLPHLGTPQFAFCQVNCTKQLGLVSFYQEEFPDLRRFFSGHSAIFKQSRHHK